MNREAPVETFERGDVVGRSVVDNSNVVQHLGDGCVLGTNSDFIYPKRLLITFLSEFIVIKSLVITAHNILGDADDNDW